MKFRSWWQLLAAFGLLFFVLFLIGTGSLLFYLSFPSGYDEFLPPYRIDTRAGSGGHLINGGATYPGAVLPFGLVALSPDTGFHPLDPRQLFKGSNLFPSGYHWDHSYLYSFSVTHFSGLGIVEGGALRIEFADGPIRWEHSSELAQPGFYRLVLKELGWQVSLTATERSGHVRFEKQNSNAADLHLLITPLAGLWRKYRPDKKAKLWRRSSVVGDQSPFFEIEMRHVGAFSRHFGGEKLVLSVRDEANRGHHQPGARWLAADPKKSIPWVVRETTDLHIGLSFRSRKHAQDAVKAHSFDQAKAYAAQRWKHQLEKIKLRQTDARFRAIFESAWYRASLMPLDLRPDGGGPFGQALGYLSLWDSFRSHFALLSLLDRDRAAAVVQTLIAWAQHQGQLPRWPLVHGDAPIMIGLPAGIVLVEAVHKGLADVTTVEHLILRDLKNRPLLAECVQFGYCPAEQGQSVSRSLELSWLFFALASGPFARKSEYFKLAKSLYENLWDQDAELFVPRFRSGDFAKARHGYASALGGAYTEGTAEQWRWSVPWPEFSAFLREKMRNSSQSLQDFFLQAAQWGDGLLPPKGYWHGNEPSLTAYQHFHNWGLSPWAQHWGRWALERYYRWAPFALAGNDDAGALSSWMIFQALGLQPLAGSDRYQLTSPRVGEAQLQLSSGVYLNLVVENQGPHQKYIAAVWWRGERLCSPQIRHQQLLKGGELRFRMTSELNEAEKGFSCLTEAQ